MPTTSNLGFGSLNTSGSGSTSLGTTLFGVDVTKLVDNLVQARALTNTRRQDKIDANTEKLSAYATLQTKLEALRTAANPLRTPRVLSGDTNVFNTKQTLTTASGTIAASALVGITAADNAEVGSHTLTINRIASADTVASSVSLPDSTSTVVLTANTTLTLGGANVALTNTMSLTQIRDAINAENANTGVTASIVQASATSYRMVLKSDDMGKAITLADDLGGTGLAELGLAASGATDTSLSAELVIDGVTALRTTNSVSDLVEGLSLELFQADAGKPMTIQVSNNLTGVSDAVTSFVTAYNDFVDFVKSQRVVGSDGTVGKDQVLFNDNLLQTNYRNIQGIMSVGANGISTGALKTLNDVGIELGADGKLSVEDSAKFEDALLSNLDEVKNLFGFGADASPGLSVVDRPDFIPTALVGKTVTVNVTATDASGTPTAASFTVDGNTVAAVITNGFIRGADGTDLEDFRIGYEGGVVGGTPYTGTFTPTQGIADQIAGALENVLDPQNGDIRNTTSTLTDTNTRIKDQIDTLTKQLEIYRARMLSQFQAAQNIISALESAQNSIKSYTDSLNSNN